MCLLLPLHNRELYGSCNRCVELYSTKIKHKKGLVQYQDTLTCILDRYRTHLWFRLFILIWRIDGLIVSSRHWSMVWLNTRVRNAAEALDAVCRWKRSMENRRYAARVRLVRWKNTHVSSCCFSWLNIDVLPLTVSKICAGNQTKQTKRHNPQQKRVIIICIIRLDCDMLPDDNYQLKGTVRELTIIFMTSALSVDSTYHNNR